MSHLQYYNYKGYGDIASRDYKYSQAVRIGDTVECSGQGGWDPSTGIIEPSRVTDVPAQIAQTFANVETALRAIPGNEAGGWHQVYKVRSYHVGLEPDKVTPLMIENYRRYCPDHSPLWTLVGVTRLGLDEMKVEIEVKAHLGGSGSGQAQK